jgi:hypothetical protein
VVAHDQAASRCEDASSFNLLQLHPKNLKDVGLRSRSRPNRIQNRPFLEQHLGKEALPVRGLGKRQAQVAQWQSTSLVRTGSWVQSPPWAPAARVVAPCHLRHRDASWACLRDHGDDTTTTIKGAGPFLCGDRDLHPPGGRSERSSSQACRRAPQWSPGAGLPGRLCISRQP